MVLDRAAPHVTRQILHDAAPVGVALGNADIPLLPRRLDQHRPYPVLIEVGRKLELPGQPQRLDCPSTLPRNNARTTATGRRSPLHTAYHWPAAFRPPPLTRQCTCGCNANVRPHVCSAAKIPGWAPSHLGSPSNVCRGLPHAGEEELRQYLSVPSPQLVQLTGQVKIHESDRSAAPVAPAVEPLANAMRTAAQTRPMATRVVPDLRDVALRTAPHVASQRGCSASPHCVCRFSETRRGSLCPCA